MLDGVGTSTSGFSQVTFGTWSASLMSTEHTANTYQSYLLRLWRDSETGPWRISLQSTRDGRQHFFSDLEEAWAFLRQRMEISKPP